MSNLRRSRSFSADKNVVFGTLSINLVGVIPSALNFYEMNYRDLEAVRQIVLQATGLEITYAYDDLVFPDNGVFIIQFDEDNNDNLFCYFQEECNPTHRDIIYAKLADECIKKKCSIANKGAFTLEQEDENIQIKFL